MVQYPGTFWKDYELVDSGEGEKLERFGNYYMVRPEPKALWGRSMSFGEWERMAHTRFRPGAGFSKAGKEDSGTWERLKRTEISWGAERSRFLVEARTDIVQACRRFS